MKTKIGTEVAHVTRNSDTTFKVERSKVNWQGRGILWRPPAQLVSSTVQLSRSVTPGTRCRKRDFIVFSENGWAFTRTLTDFGFSTCEFWNAPVSEWRILLKLGVSHRSSSPSPLSLLSPFPPLLPFPSFSPLFPFPPSPLVQLGDLRSAVSSLSGVRGGGLAVETFFDYSDV